MNSTGIRRALFALPVNESVENLPGLAGMAAIAIVLIRGLVLGETPLSFDESYYWLWSKHLAAGYLDHPPLIAFLIRAGTTVFGDSSVGVRVVPWLASAAATWAIWRCAIIMTQNQSAGSVAALIFNLMPMMAVESGVATPDSPEIAAAAFVLLFLAKIAATGYGPWWIAVGIAAGFALIAKYTGFFIGGGVIVWLAATPKLRHWFANPWPYVGAAVALAMFVPVVLWNAHHGWVSFAMQFGRTGAGSFTFRYIGEFAAAQLLLASPFIAVMASVGAVWAWRVSGSGALRLLPCMIIPGAVYFVSHSLHDRVQGNWPSFLYPALALAAVVPFVTPYRSRVLDISRRLAIPVAALLSAAIYGLALFGAIPGLRDPVSRLLGYGMDQTATSIDGWRAREHAAAIITTNYALTGWLAYYLPTHVPVIQLNERSRYLNEDPPDPMLFREPLIYVSQLRSDKADLLTSRFAHVVPLARLTRSRNGVTLDEYVVYRVDSPNRDVLADPALN